jgi:DNA-binding response OmpR family regulator
MSERILIVEDEANIASFVTLYLQKAGYTVDRASTGQEGLDLAARQPPALILLDLNLPDMDGLDVCRKLRNDSQVPILMLTARDDDVDKIVGLEVGADD